MNNMSELRDFEIESESITAFDDPSSRANRIYRNILDYAVGDDGLILFHHVLIDGDYVSEPSPFDGQPIYVPFFWDEISSWGSLHNPEFIHDVAERMTGDRDRWWVGFCKADALDWPELEGWAGIWLTQAEDGAVSGVLDREVPKDWPHFAEEI